MRRLLRALALPAARAASQLCISSPRGSSITVPLNRGGVEEGACAFDSVQIVPSESARRIVPRRRVLYVLLHCQEYPRALIKEHHSALWASSEAVAALVEKPAMQYIAMSLRPTHPAHRLVFTVTRAPADPRSPTHYAAVVLIAAAAYGACYLLVRAFEDCNPCMDSFSMPTARIVPYQKEAGSASAQCAICFESFMLDEDVRMLPCSHAFHACCVDRWLIGHNNCCPYCRITVEVVEA
ncbi:hypothetical protein PAPHI01_2093 [Pancytospora philotis]|nr:hypothetical protein PAPHI01_2093 [Pancytospora philotis]